jgi:hypothetical protein
MSPELKYEDYTVAWICALPFEATAAMFMLDELHDGEFPWRSGQETIYTAGCLNGHNVVIACRTEMANSQNWPIAMYRYYLLD